MKPYMVRFCDWAFKKLQDGEPRTAKQLFEQLHSEDTRMTRYITNAVTCSYALKADPRFRPHGNKSKNVEWILA